MSDWQPSANIDMLHARAHLLRCIRNFFAQREVLEVDTPVVCQYGVTDPHIDSIATQYMPSGTQEPELRYLMSSPEYAMKRLLAAGSGSIYQIAKAFRDGEYGHRHNPEFTLLEWYRQGFVLSQLMDEVEQLLGILFQSSFSQLQPSQWHWQRFTYAQAFVQTLGFNPLQLSDAEITQQASTRVPIALPQGTPRDTWLDLLMSHCVEPKLPDACMIYDYPASQAALAEVVTNSDGFMVARRFEVYMMGMELANGYQELTDAQEQNRRFGQDNAMRDYLHKPTMPADQRLLQALDAGMPACSGVAMGIERLLMLMCNKDTMAEVLAFDFSRA